MAEFVFRDLKTDVKNEIVIGTIEVEVTFPDGRPAAGAEYELKLDKGGTRKGMLDQNGRLVETNISPDAKGELLVHDAPLIAQAE